MSIGRPIPLILVSGFLGSGKTTFLNNLFEKFPDFKFGIIINDFGDLGVDASLIKQPDGAVVTELNNGQIFCSCLAGSFIKSVSAYAKIDIDYLLVETSGLAKPSPLLEIIEAIKKLNGKQFSYYGMISLVDCLSYLKLSEVLMAVDEQIAYSDLVLLNKIDTCDVGIITSSEMKIMSVNPEAEIIRTEYGKIPTDIFLGLKEKEFIPGPDRRYAGWGNQGRPVPLVFRSDTPISRVELDVFVNEPGGDFLRMKGMVLTDQGPVLIDCTVNSKKIILDAEDCSLEEGLVIILPADDNIIDVVKQRALKIFTSVA